MGEVRSISRVRRKDRRAHANLRLQLGSLVCKGLKIGDSVSINGVCLTVSSLFKGLAEFEMVAETIRRTNLGSLRPSDKVNIETSLRAGDGLEGHFVLGHVDGTGVVDEIIRKKKETTIWIRPLDSEIRKGIVAKGSVAIDGVSLTVVNVNSRRFSISLIPHTLLTTNLGTKTKADRVNIEVDIIGKYVAKQLQKT